MKPKNYAKGLYSVAAHATERAITDMASINLRPDERRKNLLTIYKDALIQQAVEDAVRDALSSWRTPKDKELAAEDERLDLKSVMMDACIDARIFGKVMLIPAIVDVNNNRVPLTTSLSKLAENPANYRVVRIAKIEVFGESDETINNIISDDHGKPRSYTVNGHNVHPSRCYIIKANRIGQSFIESILSYYCDFKTRVEQTTQATTEANFLAFGTSLAMLLEQAQSSADAGNAEAMVSELIASRVRDLRMSANNNGAWAYDKDSEEVNQIAKTNIAAMVQAEVQAAKFFSAAVNQTNARFLGVGTSNLSGDGGDSKNQNQTLIGMRSFMCDHAMMGIGKTLQTFNPKIKTVDIGWNEIGGLA